MPSEHFNVVYSFARQQESYAEEIRKIESCPNAPVDAACGIEARQRRHLEENTPHLLVAMAKLLVDQQAFIDFTREKNRKAAQILADNEGM